MSKKIIFLIFIFVFITANFLFAQSYIIVSGDTSGYTPGSFQITDGGAANYSIPIVIAPGTNGVQPSLALTYNSQGGNSIVGQGWSLQGISAISRTSQTYAQDGKALGISFSPSDRFSLDGERLIMLDPTDIYGGPGVEYRTEQNAFYKINSFGNTGGGSPSSFTIRTNSGNVMEYGATPDSRINAGTTTLFWLVNKISDTKGNYFTFSYYKDSTTGEYYPLRIDYTGNTVAGLVPYASVRFEYGDRSDTLQRYLNGISIAAGKKRLTAIKSYFQNTLVRSYYLTYNYSPANISQLVTLKECGIDGHCHTPTNFVWSNITIPTFTPADFNYILRDNPADKIIGLDINADGVQDIVKIPAPGGGGIQAFLSNKNPSSLSFTSTPLSPAIPILSKWTIADFNGDGKPDFLLYDSVTGSNAVYLNTDTIGGTQVTTHLVSSSPIPASILGPNKVLVTMDFNGDGRADILTFDPGTGDNNWLFSKTTGTGGLTFIPNGSLNYFPNLIADHSLFNSTYQPFFADFTGDGLMDILFWDNVTGNTKLYKSVSGNPLQADSFILAATNIITPSLVIGGTLQATTDVNGDGLPDILYYVKSSGLNRWWINKGSNIFSQVTAICSPSNLDSLITGGDNLLQLDFNGDGYSDLLWINKVTGNSRWLKNDGKLNFTLLAGDVIAPALLQNYELQGTGNFTSKSNFDFYLFNNSLLPKSRILKGTTQYNNLISQIQVGSGQVIDVHYDMLTADSVYNKSNDAIYPLMDYQATQFVVKNWQTDNGVGAKSMTSYKYYGAKIHLGGRGFRGYSQVDITDNNTGIVNSRYFLSDTNSWKFINSPLIRTTTKLPTGIIISQTDIKNGYRNFLPGDKCNFSFVTNNSSKTYETDGSFVDSTNTTYTYGDDYGNVTTTVTKYGDGFVDSLVNVYNNNPIPWIVSRLTSSRLYRIAPGHPMIVKSSAFTYDLAGGTGLLTSETIEPDSGSTVKIIKTYQYDAIGNITANSITAWNGTASQTRTTHTAYDALGRYAASYTNAQGQITYKTSDSLLGHTTTETDLNGLVKRYFYDGFGRPVKVLYPDGNWTTTDYRKCGSSVSCPSLSYHIIYQQSSVAPPVIKYYDLLNREIRTEKKGFSGAKVFVDNIYDSRGLLMKQSLPYYSTASPIYAENFYDLIGRKVRVVEPGSRVDSVTYHGRTTIYKNAKGQLKTIVKDAKEQMIICTDNEGNNLNYDYDAAGRLLKTTDPAGNNVIMTYDIHGNKKGMTDPDMGTYQYVTNGFGELIKQTDPLGNVVSIVYDSLSRMKTRTEPEGATTWTYDNRPHGKGMLGNVVSYGGYAATYSYDTLSRITNEAQTIDGATYNQGNTYDSLGRVRNILYPAGFSVTNVYNANGYLASIKNTATGLPFWTANVLNAKDEIEQQVYGNGTQINKVYDANTDFLTAINTQIGGSYLQNMSFAYDEIGNLQQRNDVLLPKQEDFYYDDLNRLTKSHVLGLDSVEMHYDVLGNILSKSDVGTYHYGPVNNRPHQLQSIDVTTTECIPSMLISSQYNSFNKVKQISKDSTLVTISYNPNRMRDVQKMYVSGILVRTKIYVSGIFQKEIKRGDTIITNFINGPEAVIGAYTTHTLGGAAATLSYFHRDHLGSLVMVTNDTGTVTARYSFDAWGKRRNADWSRVLTDSLSLAYDRGFTGHEHYDLFDIVDMNGRIYDPVLGRFLSPDPYIQDMTNLQCYNRYSYVNNNPLSFTDPTGFFSLGHFFGSIFHAVASVVSSYVNTIAHYASVAAKWSSENWRTIAVVVVAVAASVVTCGAATGLLGVIISGAAGGFASGVTATLLSGGNIGSALLAGGRGAFIGGATAAATFGVGEALGHATTFSNIAPKAIMHGVVQGGANVAQGGKFLNGFYSGLASTGGEMLCSNISANIGKIAVNAGIGGTVSSITGGNFANGAISGAYIEMFNGLGNKFFCKLSVGITTVNTDMDENGNFEQPALEACAGEIIGAGAEICVNTDQEVSYNVGVGYKPPGVLNNILQTELDGGISVQSKFNGNAKISLFGKAAFLGIFQVNGNCGYELKSTPNPSPTPPSTPSQNSSNIIMQ